MTIKYKFSSTLLGEVLIASDGNSICYIGFTDEEREMALNDLKKRIGHSFLYQECADEYIKEVMEWGHKGMKGACGVPLSMYGTTFQKAVWSALLNIPQGATTTYLEIARTINRPKAVRAVGTAIGRNNISILIPCHRVLATSGKLGGYHWGIDRKKKLLEWEGIIV